MSFGGEITQEITSTVNLYETGKRLSWYVFKLEITVYLNSVLCNTATNAKLNITCVLEFKWHKN